MDRNDIISIDRSFAGRWDNRAREQSDLLLGAGLLLPGSLFYLDRTGFGTLLVLYAETLALTNGGTLFAKGVSSRYRPYVYSDRAPLEEKLSGDSKRSFFSSHAANIAAGFFFSAKVYSDYNPGSRITPYIWAAAIGGSLAGSSLRVEAGRHFPSDVAAGAVWGGIVSYSVLHFHKKNTNILVMPFSDNRQTGVLFVKQY